MCRLGGVVLSKKDRSEERITEITEGLMMLLVNMDEAYGGDGNGASFHWEDGRVEYLKDHREANYFFRHFNTVVKWIKEGANIIQLHARMSTGGSSENHNNLHPFTHGNIVGAHNGVIDDKFMWEEMKRLGVYPYSEVDSEAIFASLNTYAPTIHPKLLQVTLDDLYGMYALSIWSKLKSNTLLLVRQDNPLSVWHDKENGEFWYASTSDLFPESLNIPIKKVRDTHKFGANKGKSYMKNLRDVMDLESGHALYIVSGDDSDIFTDLLTVDVSNPTSMYDNNYNYNYFEDDYYNIEDDYVYEDLY